MKLAQQIVLWADKLRDISAMGGHFARNPYDAAHYREIQDIAMAMMALGTATPLEELEPLRATVFARPTPLSGGEAAIIDPADGRILLVQRADNAHWAMPGGAYEVGETPAEGAVREALEETGIRCEATALVGVFDSRLCGTVSTYHIYHFLFLCHPLNRDAPESVATPEEVLTTAWFAEDALPEALHPGHAPRIIEAFRAWHDGGCAYFDR